MPLWYFECRVCQFDSDEAKRLSIDNNGVCPLCLEDGGHWSELSYRPATQDEMVRLLPMIYPEDLK
jgi:hypothetical protein